MSVRLHRRPRLLMLTHRVPYPPNRGDRIRSWHLLRTLAPRFDIHLACLADEPAAAEHLQAMRPLVTALAVRPISRAARYGRALRAFAAGQPLTPAIFHEPRLAQTIRDWAAAAPFDAVLTFCTGMIEYAREVIAQQEAAGHRPRHVLDMLDVDSLKWRAYAAGALPPMRWIFEAEARRLPRVEAGRTVPCDAIVVVSHREAAAYRRHVGHHPGLCVIGNGVDIDYFQALPEASSADIAFVGVLNYRPNVQGICWFVEHVLPGLQRQVPAARLRIVGRDPSAAVRRLARRPGVELVGAVPDVRPELARAAVVVVPLQLARGVQNKVLEAMASQRAVVCSPEAAEGIEAAPGRDLLIADTPGAWIRQISLLLQQPTLRRYVSGQARRHVESHYQWDACLQPMVSLIHPRASCTGRAMDLAA